MVVTQTLIYILTCWFISAYGVTIYSRPEVADDVISGKNGNQPGVCRRVGVEVNCFNGLVLKLSKTRNSALVMTAAAAAAADNAAINSQVKR